MTTIETTVPPNLSETQEASIGALLEALLHHARQARSMVEYSDQQNHEYAKRHLRQLATEADVIERIANALLDGAR